MKYLPLLWKNLWRKKFRTIFTLLSVLVAFVLFAVLMTIRTAFTFGVDIAGIDRLVLIHKVSLIMPLPVSYKSRLETTPGVEVATHNTWFGGVYQDPSNFFAQIVVEPEPFMRIYPEYKLPPDQMKAWLDNRQGAIVGVDLAKRFGWKIGDRIPIGGTIWQPKGGGQTWEFNIVGIYDGEEGVDRTQFFFKYDYLDENRAGGQGAVGWYVVKIADASQSQVMGAKFDAMFENSDAETKTTTEKGFVEGFANQMGNIGAIMIWISVAVLFMILLIAASTMVQSVRERTSEIAVLKTLGFSNTKILSLVLGESVFICVLGGGLGLFVGWLFVQGGDPTNGMLPIFVLQPQAIATGVALILGMGIMAGLLPALSAMQLKITDGLRAGIEDHVFTWISQTLAVTALNLRTIPQRLGSSGVAIIGIAGVVVVFVSVLSIAAGFTAAMEGAGSPSRAIVMRTGADSEMTSGLGGPDATLIKEAPGLRRDGQTALASAELFVIIDLPKKSTGTAANVPMRGVEPTAFQVRDVEIVEGRQFTFGTNEVIVGRGARGQFEGLTVGNTVHSGKATWQVVGVFSANGGVSETEIWVDARTLQGIYNRGNSYQTVLARLDSADSFNTFRDWLTTNPQLNVQVKRETEYYAAQSRNLSSLIRGVGFGIAGLMGLGAIFGALLTMYTAVSTRSREIATLRALGFNSTSVVVSVLVESMALGAIGGLIGGLSAYFAFNGYQTSTMNFQTFSQVAFAFLVTPQLLVTGLIYALIIGLIGGLLPAIRAARLPIPSALREL